MREVASLIDLAAYPIDDPGGTRGRALVENCRETLAESGALVLPGFLTAAATDLLAAEARSLEDRTHRYAVDHTVYFEPSDAALSADDPRRALVRTDKSNVAYDLIPRTALLRALYEWDATLAFVAAVLGERDLVRHPDPMAALNLNVHGEGQELGWHFDRTDFAVTLSLQRSAGGGSFEYVPNLRSRGHPNHHGIAAILAGGTSGVRRLDASPGTLTLFRGHDALHRVTPSRGPAKRLTAAFSYVRGPAVPFSAYARRLFYGRDAAMAEAVR